MIFLVDMLARLDQFNNNYCTIPQVVEVQVLEAFKEVKLQLGKAFLILLMKVILKLLLLLLAPKVFTIVAPFPPRVTRCLALLFVGKELHLLPNLVIVAPLAKVAHLILMLRLHLQRIAAIVSVLSNLARGVAAIEMHAFMFSFTSAAFLDAL
jgi:hypothetical protein